MSTKPSLKVRQLTAIHHMERALFHDDHGESAEWSPEQRAAWHALERRQEHELKSLGG